MSFLPDYPGAIVVEAANYGYDSPNRPKTWGFHTPEEKADEDPQTPGYIAGTTRDASYTYFVSSWLALVFQLVPESEGPYAHGLYGKPEPAWSDGTNLNLQSLSLSFEGYAATIHLTMPRGCPQWRAGVALVAHRTVALNLDLDITFQHKDVSNQRSDCGQWDQAAFIADVRAKIQEDDMDETTVRRLAREEAGSWATDNQQGSLPRILREIGRGNRAYDVLKTDLMAAIAEFVNAAVADHAGTPHGVGQPGPHPHTATVEVKLS